MKLKYLLIPFLAIATLIVSCKQENPVSASLSQIKVDPSYIGIERAGGSVTAMVDASDAWTIADKLPQWLTVTPMSGQKGQTKVTFSAKEYSGSSTQSCELKIKVGDKYQIVLVSQVGSGQIVPTPIKDVLTADDGKVFAVEGVVTNIVSTTWGNYTIKGKTGDIFIYGTLDSKGAPKNFASMNIEAGDKVVVQGPKLTHDGKPYMKAVTVISLKKSLIKAKKTDFNVENTAGKVQPQIVLKNNDITVMPQVDWITLVGITKDGDNTVLTLSYTENNTLAERKGAVEIKSGEDMKTLNIIQAPRAARPEDILNVDIATLLKATPSTTGPYYRISGKVSSIVNSKYGNIFIQDGTGEIYVYGLTSKNLGLGASNDKSFSSLGIKEGDYVTVVGVRGRYDKAKDPKQADQLSSAYFVSSTPVKAVSVSEFLNAKENDRSTLYELTGTVSKIKMDKKDKTKVNPYGNFVLTDASGNIYVYGLVNAPQYSKEGKFINNKSFESLGIKEGDTITIRCILGSYKNNKQAIEAYFVSKK